MDLLSTLRSRADQVEVVEVASESTQVGFEANRLKSSQIEGTKGVAVRVVVDGRLGFAASSDMSALDKLVTNALESAAYGDVIAIAFPGPQVAPEVLTYDRTITDLPIPRLVEIGQQVIDHILAIEPDAQLNVNLERGVQRASIRNQAGADVSFERSPLSMVVEVSRVKGDDVLLMFDIQGTTVWDEDYMAFVRRLGRKLELAKRSATIQSGRMPVLFAPNGALVLGLPLMLGVNGKNVYTGISPIRDKVGDKLFDDRLTLVDDATIDGKFESASHDDEGVAHRRNVLIENGVLHGFLYDLKTAVQSGVESTGNASRGLFNPPSPSPTNLIFQTGDTPVDDIIAGIDEGLLVEDVLGLGQGNVISGAFSNSLSLAFKIEKGEIVGRVKDVSIAGNVYELLREIAAVGRESEWVYNRFSLPYLLLPDVNVVAKS
ncbi:MAG TPA: TldD/PmbA family protein [Anaerolineae bacterium]|nr:TldD/PmbA family protein [Anaerolineae bacterium]